MSKGNLIVPLITIAVMLVLSACRTERGGTPEQRVETEQNPCVCVPPGEGAAEYHRLTAVEAKSKMDAGGRFYNTRRAHGREI